MSNHVHAVIYDRLGTYPALLHRFHVHLAKCQNALRGRWENLWSAEQPCVVRLVDREDVLRKLVYVATNPVKDHLVEKVHHWPGVNGVGALLSGRALRAERPRHFFRADGSMPEEIALRQSIPDVLGPEDELLAELAARVKVAEAEAAAERCRSGRRVLGRRQVLHQSWHDRPDSREPRRNLRPRVAARSVWSRIEALLRNREFVRAYRDARATWLAGHQRRRPPPASAC